MFKSWIDLYKSESELLNQKCLDMDMSDGNITFTVEFEGVKYFCSGSFNYIRSYYWDHEGLLKNNCEFDTFYMFESGNPSNVICNW